MCSPALIPVAFGAGSGLLQGLQGQAQAKQQAAELTMNAAFLNNAAADARARGRIESDQARVDTQQVIGAQRAAQAANGGEVNSGSNALLQQDAAQFGELDALIISNNAAREAYGYDVQADANRRNARQLKKNARSNLISSVLGGAVGGLGQAYSSGSLGSLFSGGLGGGTRAALSSNLNSPLFSQAIA